MSNPPPDEAAAAAYRRLIARIARRQRRVNGDARSVPPAFFGQLLTRYREASGLNQLELARRARVDPAHINRWENRGGPRTGFNLRETILKIAVSLNLDALQTDLLLLHAGLASLDEFNTLAERLTKREDHRAGQPSCPGPS